MATFHRFSRPDKNGNRYPSEILDDRIADYIIKAFPLFIYGGQAYFYDGGVFRRDDDGSYLRNIISNLVFEEFRRSDKIARVEKHILRDIHALWVSDAEVNDLQHPAFNQYGPTVINFQNGLLDVRTMELLPHSPEYRAINQVPHDWEPEKTATDSAVEDFLSGVIPDPEDREMFLQYSGYCLTTGTYLQKFLVVTGQGGTGKSVLLHLVEMALGPANYSSLKLQDLDGKNRFSSAFLLGKLANICADIPSRALEDVSDLKTITGEDAVRAEYKGGKVFTFRPYCKLLFSCNSLPRSLDEKTNAYFRRLLILSIMDRGPEIQRLQERLAENIEDFIQMSVQALHRMVVDRHGEILCSTNCRNAVRQLYRDSDTVTAWMDERTVIRTPGHRTEKKTAYADYEAYCSATGRTALGRNGFYANLREKGFYEHKSTGLIFFQDLEIIGEDAPF